MRIRYTPEPGASGVDTFSYRITNPDGGTSVGTVTVNVSGDTFTVLDDNFQFRVGEPFEFRLFSNDELAGLGATYGVTGVLPDGMTVTSDGVVFGLLTTESEGSVGVVVTSATGATGASTLSWSARLPEQTDAWMSPAYVEGSGLTDAERVNQSLLGLDTWRERFPITALELENQADQL